MPIENFGIRHMSAAQAAQLDAFLNGAISLVNSFTQNLTNEERKEFGKINEYYKLLTNKVRDLAQTQPDLRSPDVDWTEFEADYADRQFASTGLEKIDRLRRLLSDFKIVHDYDNFRGAITDYKYAKYKSGTDTPGFTEKHKELKQFFPNTGPKKKPAEVKPVAAKVG